MPISPGQAGRPSCHHPQSLSLGPVRRRRPENLQVRRYACLSVAPCIRASHTLLLPQLGKLQSQRVRLRDCEIAIGAVFGDPEASPARHGDAPESGCQPWPPRKLSSSHVERGLIDLAESILLSKRGGDGRVWLRSARICAHAARSRLGGASLRGRHLGNHG